jgi:type 1 glutamine amidotransferase
MADSDKPGVRLDVYLLCNAQYHGTDFARLELLKLLSEHDDVKVHVGNDYSDTDKINQCELLITYTCNVYPSESEQAGLRQFMEGGGRWFALHGTNAIVEFIDGKAATPDRAPGLMDILGSRFISHPANADLHVKVVDHEHPVTKGLEDFDTFDEPYYCDFSENAHTLLEAYYDQPSVGYEIETWDVGAARPQMYEHPFLNGSVLYLLLGHCRGPFDMQPITDKVEPEYCSWDQPVYYELLRRGINWGLGKI